MFSERTCPICTLDVTTPSDTTAGIKCIWRLFSLLIGGKGVTGLGYKRERTKVRLVC